MENKNDTVKIEMVEGVEGPSLYIDDHRICGNKPWGGGRVIKTWTTDRSNILDALKIATPIVRMSDGGTR